MAKGPIFRNGAHTSGRHAVTYPVSVDLGVTQDLDVESPERRQAELTRELDVNIVQEEQQRALRVAEDEARERGFKQGQERGFDLAQQQTQEQLDRLGRLVDEFAIGLQAYSESLSAELPVLVLETISLLLGDLDLRQNVISHAVQEVMSGCAQRDFEVGVAKIDLAPAKQHLQPILQSRFPKAKVQFVEDKSIQQGGCVIRSLNTTVDARLESQLSQLKHVLQRAAEIVGSD